jgi:broad-specificity NMP kinase
VDPCFFITGASGVGKSTALRLVRDASTAQEQLRFRDIDDAGVPRGVDAAWRREQVAAWVELAARMRRDGLVLVLSGVVEPGDVDDAMPARPVVVPRFCLLHASAKVLAARLRERLSSPAAAADLVRVTGQAPQQYVEAVARHAAHLHSSFAGRGDTAVIDTSDLTPQQVAEAVGTWLQEEVSRSRSSAFSARRFER